MLNERKLTENELEQRKIALKGLLKNKRALVQKYGVDAEKVMYGIATKQAKKKVENMNLDKLKEMIQDALTVKEASPFVLAADAAKDAGKKEFEFPEGSGKMHPVTIKQDIDENVDKFLLKDLLDMVSTHAATAGLTDQDAAEELLYAIGDAFNLGVDILKGPKLEENSIEKNIKVDDLQNIGYDDGEYAVSMHFNQDIIGINNPLDYKYYRRGFLQGVKDSTASYKLEERVTKIDEILDESSEKWNKLSLDQRLDLLLGAFKDPDEAEKYVEFKWNDLPDVATQNMRLGEGKDYWADYTDIGQSYLEGFGKKHSLTQDQLEKLGKKIVDQLYKGDVGKAYDAIVKRGVMKEEAGIEEANVGLDDLQDIGYDDGEYAVSMHFNKDVIGINNPLDYKYYRRGFLQGVKDSTASYKLEENEDKEPSKADLKKTKGLAKAKEELALLTREMKSLAKKYSKAEGEEKEKLVADLKKKTKLKKELEAIIDK